jgi:hypothetical protein
MNESGHQGSVPQGGRAISEPLPVKALLAQPAVAALCVRLVEEFIGTLPPSEQALAEHFLRTKDLHGLRELLR